MRLFCFHCGKSVSTELPEDTVFRAIAICPECIEKEDGIEIEKRSHDWMAFKAGHREIWECAETPQQAIQKLLPRLSS